MSASDTLTAIEMIEAIDEVMRALNDFYDSPGAAVLWLTSEQPLLGECIPLVLIKNGKAGEVMELIEAMGDGVYI